MHKHKLVRLKNGLQLVVVPLKQVESVTVMVGVGAGSRYESRQINGLSHFLEHMAFKGTKKRPSTLDIASEIDAVGGKFNAFTDKEFTGYWIKLAARHIELAFDILSDILTDSLFDEQEIEREKGVIIEEINMYEDTPIRKIWDVFIRLLYGNNPMGWEIIGKKKSIRSLQRKNFFRYLERLYFPRNMSLVVAGKTSFAQALFLAKKYFAQLKRTSQKQIKTIKPEQGKAKTKLVYKKTEQAHICLGVPGYELDHPDRFALSVLATVLGGGMSSRLFIKIRERRGLAYYVDCNPDFFTDSGFLMVRAGVKLERTEEALRVALNEWCDLIKKKVSPKELEKAKEFNKGRLILALEDSWAVANRYAYQVLLEKKIRTPQETIRLIDKVTAGDVQRVARDIFRPEKLNLAIIGPYKNKERFQKIIERF